tara:strand:+ start:339 stop:1169 length:831 start_codon:yes stop_codon:yes gene_type:complete
MEAKSSPKEAPKRQHLGKDHKRKIKHTCEYCDYTTCKMSNYKKHLKSKKHIKNMSLSGFQKSSPKKPERDEEIKDLKDQVSNLTKLLGKVLENGISNTTNNNTNCNNTNINNTMTVNVYLNDHCKDALNIKDFVDQIEVQLEDILHPSKLLKDNIVPNIFMNNLKKLSNEERPVHCADARRGKFFVKDKDEWTEIKKEEPLNPLNSQIGMLKFDVYKKAQEAEEQGIINDDKVQKIRDACGISPTPTMVDNKIINKIASECSLLEARKKKSLENID